MMPQMFIFLFIAIGIYFLVHFYIFKVITKNISISNKQHSLFRIIFLLLALLFPLSQFLNRIPHISLLNLFVIAGGFWIGIISISLTIFLARSLLVFVFRSPKFRYYSFIVSSLLILLLSSYSLFNQYHKVYLREITIKSDKIDDSFSIVQLSDLHLNYSKSSKRLRKIVETVNSLNPDVIVITGDIIDADLSKTGLFPNILRDIKARYSVLAITGNHEYYIGIEHFLQFTKNSNMIVL